MSKKQHFDKPALTIPEQITNLENRGIQVRDKELAIHYLKFIGYYRLSGYAKNNEGMPLGNISFDDILEHYIFDRKLRMMLFDSIERIEVALRGAITSVMAEKYGAFWFTNKNLFITKIGLQNIDGFSKVYKMISDSTVDYQNKDGVLKEYYNIYSSPDLPPSWIVMESLSMGVVSKILSLLNVEERKTIANQFQLKEKHLVSWMRSLTYTRNLCAHHSRVWNRVFTVKLIADKTYNVCRQPNFAKGQLYSQAVVIAILLNVIAPDNHWERHIKELLGSSKHNYALDMGFPEGWQGFNLDY